MNKLHEALLTEKVNKWEINKVLSDDDLLSGIEVEFIIPAFLEKYADKIKKWETMARYNTELEEYDEALEKWEDRLENEDEDTVGPPPPLPKWAVELGYEEGESLPDPKEDFPELQMDIKEIFGKLVEEFLPIDKLPFNNYVITHDSYHKDSKKWVIKPDGSLGASGIEMVSPILPISEVIRICPKVFDFIDKYGEVNDSCGFHIGMSIKGVSNLGKYLDVVKLSLFTDEDYIYKYFDLRKYNGYAQSAQSAIKGANINKEKIYQFINTKKLEAEYSDSHYMAINIEHLDSDNQYIEFRYLGGNNYHKKWDRVKNTIAQYGWNLLIACDPEFKKKEYLLKLHNIMLKIELFSSIVRVNELMKDNGDERTIKELTTTIKVLNKRITLTNDDIITFADSMNVQLEDIDHWIF